MKTILTPEQSATLIARGISAERASEITEYDDAVSQWTHKGAPLFTLADIISLLPRGISDESGDYVLRIQPRQNISGWIICYFDSPGKMKGCHQNIELIDALYLALIWCLNNNHVKLD